MMFSFTKAYCIYCWSHLPKQKTYKHKIKWSSDKPANLNIFATQATEDLSLNFFESMNLPQGN